MRFITEGEKKSNKMNLILKMQNVLGKFIKQFKILNRIFFGSTCTYYADTI